MQGMLTAVLIHYLLLQATPMEVDDEEDSSEEESDDDDAPEVKPLVRPFLVCIC